MTTIPYLKQNDTDMIDTLVLYNILCGQTNPNIDKLKIYLDTIPKHKQSLSSQALELKYRAMITVPTTIEKTMSPAQLFKSESPLWAHGQTFYYIQQVQELYDRIKHDKQKKSKFYKLFDDLLNSETHYWTACHIEEM